MTTTTPIFQMIENSNDCFIISKYKRINQSIIINLLLVMEFRFVIDVFLLFLGQLKQNNNQDHSVRI